MRRFLVILCLLANLSLVLMPFDSTHAHVSSDHSHATAVHGGHNHDFDHGMQNDQGDEADRAIVDLKPALSSQNTFQSAFLTFWLPLACTFVLALLVVQLCLGSVAPTRSDPKPLSHHPYWRPPLRGPPSFSI